MVTEIWKDKENWLDHSCEENYKTTSTTTSTKVMQFS